MENNRKTNRKLLESLGIGRELSIRKRGDEMGWDWTVFGAKTIGYDEHNGYPIKIIKNSDNQYHAISATRVLFESHFIWANTREKALKQSKERIDRYLGANINYINREQEFERKSDPKEAIGLGLHKKIKDWFASVGISESSYVIREDGTIDTPGDINLTSLGLEELPPYINFNVVGGSLYAGGNPWKSLRGFPTAIRGDFQIQSVSVSPYYNLSLFGDFSELAIRKKIRVYGKIWN